MPQVFNTIQHKQIQGQIKKNTQKGKWAKTAEEEKDFNNKMTAHAMSILDKEKRGEYC